MSNQNTVWTSIEEAASSDLVEDGAVESVSRLPEAKYKGFLNLMGFEVPCYVLETGQRVIGRTSATEMLTGIKGGGGLEKYRGFSPETPILIRNPCSRDSFRLDFPKLRDWAGM